jgi:hypothetical protein
MMKARIVLLVLGLGALILLSFAGCSEEEPASPGGSTGDQLCPDAVTDLRIGSVVGNAVTLNWTAPGDDGDTGTASTYDMRYSRDPITDANWDASIQASTEPAPAAPGTNQSATINTSGRGDFHFALKTADEASNWSALSNVVMASVTDGFVIHQLTSEGHNQEPHLDDGFVVWVGAYGTEGDNIYIANLESAFPTPTRLTDNGGEKQHPNNHGAERIVWEGRGGSTSDWEIWLYNHYSIPRYSQFTDNDVPDHKPDLAGAGHFAWFQGRTMFEEVHYWNESMHRESVISDGCCPTDRWSNDFLSADDYEVVWRSYDRTGGEGHRIYLWDGVVTDISDAPEGGMGLDYSLFEGSIAYVYGDSIRYWDGSTTVKVGKGYDPSLYNGTIAYEVWAGNNWEIRYWDGTTVHEITDNDYNDTNPSLYGTIIAWTGRPAGSSDQIFYVDVTE